jgi:hypothetical protein
MEAKRLSRIYFFDAAFELFLALFFMPAKAYDISSLHDRIQLTVSPQIRREETVEFP